MKIRPRCFVVMPYGRKPVGPAPKEGEAPQVDFDAVYERLLVPALREAGCSWFRSSEEVTSADIRTGMFYELATSDFVLSDISIPNPNVFYELGIRHGLSNRGSILVHGGWSTQPIDIAVDRSFRYDGALFARDDPDAEELSREVRRLAALIGEAVRTDPRHVSSPVYKELRGLAAPDVSKIEIARVAHTNRWYREWAEKVRTAQNKGSASDIMTLAGDAANSLQAAEVFYTAAWALIGLERFEFAEELLRAAVQADPMHVEAQCQLGLVLNRRGQANEAAESLNRVRQAEHDSVNWLGALGRVHKDMWRDTWEREKNVKVRLDLCLDNQERAYNALDMYKKRLERNADSHYAAINLCAIVTWLAHAAEECQREVDRKEEFNELLAKSKEVVRRVGETDLGKSGDRGYWACTSLAELALCEHDLDKAERLYTRAAHWPGRGKFDIQSMLSHLSVYESLGWEKEATQRIIERLENVAREVFAEESFDKVALCLGHMTNKPEDPGTVSDVVEKRLASAINDELEKWDMTSSGNLALCRGVRGAEMIFAEACASRDMTVRLLIPLPEDDFIGTCVHWPHTEWQTRYTRLIGKPNVEVRFQDHELGAPPPTTSAMHRGVLWCLNTARVAARSLSQFHLLLVWPDELAESRTGFGATLQEMVRLPAIRTDLDPDKLPMPNESPGELPGEL